MTMKTIQKVSEETLTIENYLSDANNGQFIAYAEIEKELKVKMDQAGKGYLRTALKRLKLEYECEKGVGIRLADADSATTIVVGRLVKIDNAVKKGEKTYSIISSQFYDQLSPEEQRQILFVGAAFGAIRAAAQNGKKVLKQNKTDNYKTPLLPNV